MENILYKSEKFSVIEVFENLDNIENIVKSGTFGMIAFCN